MKMANLAFPVIVQFLLVVFLPSLGSSQDDDFRTWKSKRGDHKVEAKLDNYDTKTNTVILLDANGDLIKVELELLSSSDQRFVKREIRKRASIKSRNPDNRPDDNPFRRSNDLPPAQGSH